MIYSFICQKCGTARSVTAPISVGPPEDVDCQVKGCSGVCDRDWQTDAPMLDTSRCKDANEVAPHARVLSAYDRGTPEQMEGRFQKHIKERRKELADGNRGSIKQTHSVPAHLYHGKIKETKDPDYWKDPSNLSRHNECRVDK